MCTLERRRPRAHSLSFASSLFFLVCFLIFLLPAFLAITLFLLISRAWDFLPFTEFFLSVDFAFFLCFSCPFFFREILFSVNLCGGPPKAKPPPSGLPPPFWRGITFFAYFNCHSPPGRFFLMPSFLFGLHLHRSSMYIHFVR